MLMCVMQLLLPASGALLKLSRPAQAPGSGAWHTRLHRQHSPCMFPASVLLLVMQVGEGGVVFFRESCFRQSGDKQRRTNPTHYRRAWFARKC